jgi:ankyrin repeat domain-containing protein 50
VIEQHLEKYLDGSDEMVAYCYCSQSKATSSKTISTVTSSEAILRSFARQISWSAKTGGIEKLVLKEYRSRGSQGSASYSRVKSFLSQLIPTYKRTSLIIDALDECENPDTLFTELKSIIDPLVKKHQSQINLFISSRDRPLNFSPGTFANSFIIPITGEDSQDDMVAYIQQKIRERNPPHIDDEHPEVEDQLERVLIRKSQGA